MKGIIWNICPLAQIADISNSIAPQNILEAALTLERAYSFFPEGSVHLAVVDPGVGTSRRPLAARLGKYFYVGPDNGLFTPLLEDAERNNRGVEIVELASTKYFLPQVSHTFHGRDIFAPAAAHLANGVHLGEMGPLIHDPVRLAMPKPIKTEAGWRAHILRVDVFGNLVTDLSREHLTNAGSVNVRLGELQILGLVASYGQARPGELIALINSEDRLEVAVVNGSAAEATGAIVGDLVDVIW